MVFICGPYRANAYSDVDKNIESARDVALACAAEGFYPITPHLNTGHFDTLLPARYPDNPYAERVFLEGCHVMLSVCDAVYLMTPDNITAGMRDELALANSLNIPIFHEIDRMITYQESLLEEDDDLQD